MMMQILVTGSTGFIGQRLVNYLLEHTDLNLNLAVRSEFEDKQNLRIRFCLISDISVNTNWQDALFDCQVVIHAAGRVHVMQEDELDPLSAFRDVNVEGSLNLARQAAMQGVKRFIYLSSIKVNGELTSPGNSFCADDPVNPQCEYALSKYEAEQGLLSLAIETGMEVVIIRPVLVYGPCVKGNFIRMMDWVKKGIPLPFGLVNNQRSFVSVDNLVSLINKCIEHPLAGNQIFLVSDGHDLSTKDLLVKLRPLLNKWMLLVPVPVLFLNFIAKIMGQQVVSDRLFGSLQVDISKTCELLDWQPNTNVDVVLSEMVEEYLASDASRIPLMSIKYSARS